MSQLHEQKYYMQWNDSSLHKSYSLYWIPTSEEERPFFEESQILSHCIPLKGTSSGCCLCHRECSRKKSPNLPYESHDIKKLYLNCQGPQKARGNLELHLTGTRVEEAVADDRQRALIQHLDLCTVALEALLEYGKSLQITQLAACRVLNISHLLTFPQPRSTSNSKPDSINLTLHLQQLEVQKEKKLMILQDLIEHCSKHITLPIHLSVLLNDHYAKKRNFYIAAKNLKNFLNNSKLSVPRMEKLHRQYDIILNDYRQSRHTLELQLPKVINIRLALLREGFEKVKEFHKDDNDANEIEVLFKLIGEKLSLENANTATVSQEQLPPQSQLCQKCKINRIDEE